MSLKKRLLRKKAKAQQAATENIKKSEDIDLIEESLIEVPEVEEKKHEDIEWSWPLEPQKEEQTEQEIIEQPQEKEATEEPKKKGRKSKKYV